MFLYGIPIISPISYAVSTFIFKEIFYQNEREKIKFTYWHDNMYPQAEI